MNSNPFYHPHKGIFLIFFTQYQKHCIPLSDIYGKIPARPAAGGVVDMDYDFTALDTILPHPVYAWMGWVSVLNPSNQTLEQLKLFIQEAYEFSVEKFKKRK